MASIAELLFNDVARCKEAGDPFHLSAAQEGASSAPGGVVKEASSSSPGGDSGFTLVLTAEASDHDEVLELLQLLVSWPAAAAVLCGVLGQGQRQQVEEVRARGGGEGRRSDQ